MTTTSTSTRRPTKRAMFNELLAIPEVNEKPELVEFINNELALLSKKASSGTSKPTANHTANEGYKLNIIEYLSSEEDKQATVTELWKNVPELKNDENMSNQRISAILRQMIEENKIERVVEKRVAYFKLV
jgi:hypothetical protein